MSSRAWGCEFVLCEFVLGSFGLIWHLATLKISTPDQTPRFWPTLVEFGAFI